MRSPKKRRVKAYKPKPVKFTSMEWALAGACTLPIAKQIELVGMVDSAIAAFRRGAAVRADWLDATDGMNIAEALIHFQIATNLLPEIASAQNSLRAVALRMLANGKSVCYASELAAMVEGRDIYKIQLSLCTQAEIGRAVNRVRDMHRSGAMQDMVDIFERLAA